MIGCVVCEIVVEFVQQWAVFPSSFFFSSHSASFFVDFDVFRRHFYVVFSVAFDVVVFSSSFFVPFKVVIFTSFPFFVPFDIVVFSPI